MEEPLQEERLLLCTDLDRTLLPNGPQAESPGARDAFARLVQDRRVTLAYVSGRHRELVRDAMVEWSLPTPDWVIGDVGTTLWQVDAWGDWRRDEGWENDIGADWAGRRGADLAELLNEVPELTPQPKDRQNIHKLSYFLAGDVDTAALAPRLQERLQAAGVRARLVFSIDETRNEGLLDVLPERASKLHAIEALMTRLGVDDGQTLFAGDSGNDLEVLTSSLPAVLVANATDPVRTAARDGARAAGHAARLYCARGGFNGMNGCYAAGIVEGAAHFHPWTAGPLSAGEAAA